MSALLWSSYLTISSGFAEDATRGVDLLERDGVAALVRLPEGLLRAGERRDDADLDLRGAATALRRSFGRLVAARRFEDEEGEGQGEGDGGRGGAGEGHRGERIPYPCAGAREREREIRKRRSHEVAWGAGRGCTLQEEAPLLLLARFRDFHPRVAPAVLAALTALGGASCARSPGPPDRPPAAQGSPAASVAPDAAPALAAAPTDVAEATPPAPPSAEPVQADAPADARLGWPDDRDLRGLYAHIGMLGQSWFPGFLRRMAINGMNAVVFDAKDYTGWLTYPSAIPLAVETQASSHAVLKALSPLVHVAHEAGLRVVLRISCFHDPWVASRRSDLAIPGMRNWLNPNNTDAQDYLLAILDETIATGVDEIQLDYVRYPTEGIKGIDFGLGGKKKTTDVIAGFVKRMHDRTKAAGVPLSIDIFGVVAWQRSVDVLATGQDLARLGAVVEAVSPMVYPSHFQEGFNGYSAPGDHPDVVAYGTRQAYEVLKRSHSHAVIRPWIQAFSWKAPSYDASYVAREILSARNAYGVGWLAWNAGGYYNEVMTASASNRPPRRAGPQGDPPRSARRRRPGNASRGRGSAGERPANSPESRVPWSPKL